MTETELNVSAEALAGWLISRQNPLPASGVGDRSYSELVNSQLDAAVRAARRMLAADALYEAGRELLRVADATDCDEPMTEQFDGQRKQQGYRIRLNESLSDAQFGMATALVLADGKEKKPWR